MTTVNGQFRPVSWSRIYVTAANLNSCGTQSGVMTLNISPKYSYSSATVTPTSVSGGTVTWNLTGLNSLSQQTIIVYVTPATSVSLGDTVCNTVSITPTSGDVNTANNTDYRCNTVVSSFDPNEKSVQPLGNFIPGNWLTYRIDFENLGNDTAFNIHILDTLSSHLDENSVEVINTTHAMTHSVIKIGTLNILKFNFDNILLPDSNSKLYNKGYVQFKIRTKTGLPVNTSITNRAGIFFDINPVVMTNTVENMSAVNSVENIAGQNTVNVHPNPTNDMLYIDLNNNKYNTLQIINNLGQVLIQKTIAANSTNVSIKQLTPGIYHLMLKGESGTKVIKIEKQ
jgi:uncharacterized repeat protein (TIGR01451 family)